ncbi:hypothetical protein FB451DRAFT_1298111, partial [Mycena latifolia]
MEDRNVLQIQELLDQCIEFLCDSRPDLKACALVSRSWTFAAQVHLFREVQIKSISSPNLWPRLQEILRSSPHLIRHIRRLHFNSEAVPLARVFEICEIPFTHLHHVSARHTNTPLPVELPIPQLLGLPTLTRVKIVAQFRDPSSFLRLWERCSPNLRHLDLYCFQRSDQDVLPVPAQRCPPIALESLRIRSIKYIGNWLADALCPLEISQLKVFSIIHGLEDVLQWPRFAPALRTIQVLDFIPRVHPTPGLIRIPESPHHPDGRRDRDRVPELPGRPLHYHSPEPCPEDHPLEQLSRQCVLRAARREARVPPRGPATDAGARDL